MKKIGDIIRWLVGVFGRARQNYRNGLKEIDKETREFVENNPEAAEYYPGVVLRRSDGR